jgi:hypothetical protein
MTRSCLAIDLHRIREGCAKPDGSATTFEAPEDFQSPWVIERLPTGLGHGYAYEAAAGRIKLGDLALWRPNMIQAHIGRER